MHGAARAPTFQCHDSSYFPDWLRSCLGGYEYSRRAVNQRNRHSFCYQASIEQPNIVVTCLLVVMVTDRGFTIAQEWVLPAGTMTFYSGALRTKRKTCIGHSCSYSTPHRQSLVSKQSMYQVSLETNICVCTATNDHYRSDGHVIREHNEYRLTDRTSHGKRNKAAQ